MRTRLISLVAMLIVLARVLHWYFGKITDDDFATAATWLALGALLCSPLLSKAQVRFGGFSAGFLICLAAAAFVVPLAWASENKAVMAGAMLLLLGGSTYAGARCTHWFRLRVAPRYADRPPPFYLDQSIEALPLIVFWVIASCGAWLAVILATMLLMLLLPLPYAFETWLARILGLLATAAIPPLLARGALPPQRLPAVALPRIIGSSCYLLTCIGLLLASGMDAGKHGDSWLVISEAIFLPLALAIFAQILAAVALARSNPPLPAIG